MRPSALAYAFMLLQAAPGTPESVYSPEIAAALRHVAVAEELMSPEETQWYFNADSRFQAELDSARGRRLRLEGAPPLADAAKLPHIDRCVAALNFNEEFRRQLSMRLLAEPHRADVILRARADADECYKLWGIVRDAAWDRHNPEIRRNAMRCLRDRLGDGYNGPIAPPIVPEWTTRPER